MTPVIETDVVIVGAGPVALFAAFQLGLFKLSCHLIDATSHAGGQISSFYSDKPIYDIPGYPKITAEDLVERLLEQAAPYDPQFHFNRQVSAINSTGNGKFEVKTNDGEVFISTAVIVTTGIGILGTKTGKSSKNNSVNNFGLEIQEGLVKVDTEKFQTSVPGIYAIGDACTYPGKLKLILSGFHEAALATQAVRKVFG